jgi:hypothetical protein
MAMKLTSPEPSRLSVKRAGPSRSRSSAVHNSISVIRQRPTNGRLAAASARAIRLPMRCRHERNQPQLVGPLLQFARHPHIHDHPVDGNHPHQRILDEAAGKRPPRIQRHDVEEVSSLRMTASWRIRSAMKASRPADVYSSMSLMASRM